MDSMMSMSSSTIGSAAMSTMTSAAISASSTMSSMSMAMSMTMGSPTSSSMSMATSMSSSSSDMMMGMDSMMMVFFTSTTTSLYSSAWTPNTTGQYAGTCIFLIVFATIWRALLATRIHLFHLSAVLKTRRRPELGYKAFTKESLDASRPWRAQEAISLAIMDVILAGTSYLLMIAVMTMNVGYFLSILGGVFLGSLIFGHFTLHATAH